MKRALAAVLCFVTVLAGLSGCGGESHPAAASVGATPAQMETSQATGAVSEDQGAAVATEEAEEPPLLQLDSELAPKESIHIAVVAKSTEGGYWKCMKKHMKEAVGYINEFYGLEGDNAVQVTFEGPDSEEKVEDQINTIDAVLAENPSVLCLAAIDMDSCQAQMETAADNGIPVVLFDSKVKNGDGTAFCATDNRAAGAEGARRLCAAMNGEGKAVVFADAAYSHAARNRVKGFQKEIETAFPDVSAEHVFLQESEGDSRSAISDVLEKGRADGIFCTSQAVAEQVLSCLEAYPEKEIPLVGFDAGIQQVQAVREGRETGMVVQDIPLMARQTIQAALYAAAEGEPDKIEKNIKVDHVWVDSESLEEAVQKGLLYD